MTLGEIVDDHIIPTLTGRTVRLSEAADVFSFRRQPSTMMDRTFCITDSGLITSRPMGAHRAARIDAVEIAVALRATIASGQSRRTMWDLLTTIERALIADGEAQGYHVATVGRDVKRATGREFVVGTLRVTVDYDFAEA